MDHGERLCRACSAPLPPGARFCPACGTKVSAPCHACGAETEPDDRFCRSCGAPLSQPAQRPADDGENRPLTILFSDLVGSTTLAHALDPEDWRELLRRYQAGCARAITGQGGMIAQYLGDGVLAYFGHPVALEDAAFRAADAARQILSEAEAVGREISAHLGVRVDLRVAVHSGMVLVGEMGVGLARERHSAVGALPNVTARLQELAPVNAVVISEQVRRNLGDAFETRFLGRHRLKGATEEIGVYELGPRQDAPHAASAGRGELVGRTTELGVLRRAWDACRESGTGAIVTVAGEPGAGKSTLLRRFLGDLGAEGVVPLVIAGTIAERQTPYGGLWRLIERGDDGLATPALSAREGRLGAWLAANGCTDPRVQEAILALRAARLTAADSAASPADLRADIQAAFRTHVARLPRPLLIVLEDAHWIDPSTLEMVDAIMPSAGALPSGLLLVTTRPGRRFPWSARRPLEIELSALGERECRAIMAHVAGGVPPDRELAAQIASMANGLPLFVEEMTRMLIERGLVSVALGQLRLKGVATDLPTPSSLLDLLMARLDSLGEAKALSQAAAVLGRVVCADALSAVTNQERAAVLAGLERLLDAMVVEADRGRERYQFRHALFQKAAYETLLKSRRVQLHGAYVDWLVSGRARDEPLAPETLAYHCFGARRYAEAVGHYREAGLLAARTGSGREAAAYFRRAIEALELAEPGAGPSEAALELQVNLAGALLSAEGPGAEATAAAYERAIEISEAVPESRWHFPAYWGWWRISSNFPEMSRRAARIVAVAERMEDREFKLQSHHCMWANAFQIGALGESLAHARRGVELYRPGVSAEQSILYGGHDCLVCAHGEIALARWLQGAGDSATQDIARAVAHGEALGHDGSLLHALDIATTLQCYRRDPADLAAMAARLARLGDIAGLEEYIAKGRFFEGWAACARGDLSGGLGRMNEAFGVLEAVATNEDFPLFHGLRAEAMRGLGDLDGAEGAIAAAREVVAAEGVTYWAAEIERQAAETEIARRRPDEDRISALLAEGRRIAGGQGALALELRNAMTLARWRGALGDRSGDEALARLLDRLPEGAEGRDIAEARAVLGGLRR